MQVRPRPRTRIRNRPDAAWMSPCSSRPRPDRSFASDNAAGAHPAVLEAVAAANDGHALAYGDDRWTRECESLFRELFGRGETLPRRSTAPARTCSVARPAAPGRRRGVRRRCPHRRRRDRRGRAHPRRQADPVGDPAHRAGGRQAASRSSSTSSAGCSAASTTPSRRWCRSPRAPSSAPCTRPTRWPRSATPPTPGDARAHGRRPHRQRHRRARGEPSGRCGRSPSTPGST